MASGSPGTKWSAMEDSLKKLPALTSRLKRWIVSARAADTLVLLAAIGLAIAVRVSVLDFKSLDFYASLKPWYNMIKAEGFAAFATGFSTYNPPYLYLLYLVARFLPNTPVVVAVKLPSLVADFVCAYLAFLIVARLEPQRPALPTLAALAVLFAPSVGLNSAFWGQADSLFTAGLLACVYFLQLRQHGLAMLSFGLAVAFKLQAVFMAPVVLALLLRKELPWRSVAIVPLVLFAAIVPAWVVGRPLSELLGVYLYQTSQFESITMNAPTVYAWLPDTKRVFNELYVPAVFMGAAASVAWLTLLYKAHSRIRDRILLEVSLVSMLIVPLFLPKMHERYFFPADVLSIVFAFVCPRFFYVPILVVGASFLSYQPFLFERQYVPLPYLALVLIATTAILSYHSLKQLYGGVSIGEARDAGGPPAMSSQSAPEGDPE